jgi:hypothetical protein
MATNVRDTQDDTGTDPAARSPVRPDYIFLGVDGDGGDHVYRTFEESVHVIRDGRGVHVQEFDGKDVDHWMAYIEGKRGWANRRYGVSLLELLEEALAR